MSEKIFCRGSNDNVECPHCGKGNHYVCHGVKAEFGKVSLFARPCSSCGWIIYYQAVYELAIKAEKTNSTGCDLPSLGQPVFKKFLLVFTDLLTGYANKPSTRVVYGFSQEDVVARFCLVERKMGPAGYWDGKNGEVVITIQEVIDERELVSPQELRAHVLDLYTNWY